MRHLGFWFLWLALTPPLVAQRPTPEYERSYQSALQLLRSGKYEPARQAFVPLTQARYANARVAYAHYFYALASLKSGKSFEAKTILRQLFERYPAWEKKNEAWYLMANASFEDEDYTLGMEYLKKIGDSALRPDATKLEDYYLARCRSLPVLKGLYVAYPDDRVVAYNLMDLIQRTSTDKSDLELSDRLTNRFGIRKDPPPVVEPVPVGTGSSAARIPRKTGPSKGFYNVGILFPFAIEELDERDRASRNTRFAVDLYNGIRLAVRRLQSEGVIINLYVFDVENDARQMLQLVTNTSFQQMDLLIGPLYAETNKVATAWAVENSVPLVNPISANRRLVDGLPNLFLAQPSWERQGIEAAIFAKQRFGAAPAVVFYGLSRSDSLMAAAYVQQMKEQKLEVLGVYRNLEGSAETVSEAAPALEGKRVGHVFVASTQKGSGAAFLTALGRNRLGDVPVVLPAESFNLSTVSASQFNGRDVFLIDPNFVEREKQDALGFEKAYLNRYNVPPSSFAYWGYDQMLFFGKMLSKYGTSGLREGLNRQASREGFTLGGFDYANANDNRVVPILTYDNYKLVLAK
ncbi:MAG: ABC transporter substrate-binding protein [Cytophagaceae bacterium]|nr:ABC transporter substrate-binding protein [Cytophagaceae bacterium]